jgi:NitT/TauT family transport system substrate-binding protein
VSVALLLGAAGTASAQSVVRIGFIPAEGSAPLYLAHERGYFKAQGVTTELVRLTSGAAILTQVSTGDLQAGQGALSAAGFNATHAKLPVAFVAPMHFAYIEDNFVVRKADIDAGRYQSIADLKGKSCASNAKGVATEWMLDQALRLGGLTVSDVELKTLPFPEMLAALENGAIQCGLITEPFATQAETKGVGVRPLQVKAGAKPVPVTTIFWNSEWAKKNDALARGYMLGYLKAVRELSEPGAWRSPANMEVIQKYTRVAPEVLMKTRPPLFNPNLELDEKVMMDQQEFYVRQGYLKYTTPKPIRELVDLSHAEGAVKQLGWK